MYTVLKRNLEDAKRLLEFADKLKVDGVIFERFIPLGQGKKISDEVISGEELEGLYRDIFRQCDSEYLVEEMVKYRALQVRSVRPRISGLNNFNPARFSSVSMRFGHNSETCGSHVSVQEINSVNVEDSCIIYGAECVAGSDGCAILSDGTVLPCRRFYLPVGNLVSESLIDIWRNSKILNDIRDRNNLKGKCKNCYVSDCIGCRAMTFALTGDYLGEDTHCLVDINN